MDFSSIKDDDTQQEAIQKRTFTNWMNSCLRRFDPPILVHDLFQDVQDGLVLAKLLEILSSKKVPWDSAAAQQRTHKLSNIRNIVDFLTNECKIKLININPSDIVDGKPSIVLGLIWIIILHFQIGRQQELSKSQSSIAKCTPVAASIQSKSSSSPSGVSGATPESAKTFLLSWINNILLNSSEFDPLKEEIKDFGFGWRNGRRFALLLHAMEPNLVNMKNYPGSITENIPNLKQNLKNLFEIAERELHIPQLIEPQDVDIEKPDERSIMTYLAQFLKKYLYGKSKTDVSDDRSGSTDQFNKNEDEDEGIGDLQVPPLFNQEQRRVPPPGSTVDPNLVMSEHSPPLHRRQTGFSATMPTSLSNEELQLIMSATGGSEVIQDSNLGSTLNTTVPLTQSMPVGGLYRQSPPSSPPGRSTSPHRMGKAKTYAGLKLGRVAKNVSKCRALARIKVTADTEEKAQKHNVTILKSDHQLNEHMKEQADKEYMMLINIKEMITRIRHDPIQEQDFLSEFDSFQQAQSEHECLTAYLIDLSEKKRKGSLLGINPDELENVEAEWSRVKPALDEWRWRLDSSLPGDWRQIGIWLSNMEKNMDEGAMLALKVNASNEKGGTPDERTAALKIQLDSHTALMSNYEEIKEEFFRIKEFNIELDRKAQELHNHPEGLAQLPVILPFSIVETLEKRILKLQLSEPMAKRRLIRIFMRWELHETINKIRLKLSELEAAPASRNKDDLLNKIQVYSTYLKTLGLPGDMEDKIVEFTDLSEVPDMIAIKFDEINAVLAAYFGEDKRGSDEEIPTSVIGGGARILIDLSETERKECLLYLRSITVRWSDLWTDMKTYSSSISDLSIKWEKYDSEVAQLNAWIAEAKRLLEDENLPPEERRRLYEEMAMWKNRIAELNSLAQTIMSSSDAECAALFQNQLLDINEVYAKVSDEVIRSVQMDVAERLRLEHHEALTKLQEMLDDTEALLSHDFILPQTADLKEAEAATLDYRQRLEKAREELLSNARLQYENALRAAELMMEAARNGEASMEEAEELMQRAKKAGELLDKLANSKVQERLEEVHAATVRAVDLALQLAKLNIWNQDSEEVGVLDEDANFGEMMGLDLLGMDPEEAFAKLKLHFHSIDEHERALREAEERLAELKALGLKNVDISHLENAIAEARTRFELMRAVAKKQESELSRRRDLRSVTNSTISKLQQWLDDTHDLFIEDEEILESQSPDAKRIQRLENMIQRHDTFFIRESSRLENLLSELKQCETLITESAHKPNDNDELLVKRSNTQENIEFSTILADIEKLKYSIKNSQDESVKKGLQLRFALKQAYFKQKIEAATELLNEEEYTIEKGGSLNKLLVNHEMMFDNGTFSEDCYTMLQDMNSILDEYSSLVIGPENEDSELMLTLTHDRKKLKTIFERANNLVNKLKNLPEKWLEYDSKFKKVNDWLAEFKELSNALSKEPMNLTDDQAAGMAKKYRDMLNRFEELAGSSVENSDQLDHLVSLFDRLTEEGGLTPEEIAERKTNLAGLISRMRDLKEDLGGIMEKANLTVENLEYMASAALEKQRAKNVKIAFEQTVEQDLETLPDDLESLKRLLADREAMVARMAQEREASLQAMLQRGGVQAETVEWTQPAETELRANWAEVDRIAEASLATLRQAAEAYENFEETKNKLTGLLAGARHLVTGTADVRTISAFVSAISDGNSVDLQDLGMEIPENSNYTLAAGLAGMISGTVESATAAGLNAVRTQSTASKAQLEALLSAEADLKFLRSSAEKLKGRAASERVQEIDSTILKLEAEINESRILLNDRLERLQNSDVSWTNLYSNISEYENFLQTQEDKLNEVVSVDPQAAISVAVDSNNAVALAARAALEEVLSWKTSTLDYEHALKTSTDILTGLGSSLINLVDINGVSQTEEKLDELETVERIETSSKEVIKFKSTMKSLQIRKVALEEAFQAHVESVDVVKDRLESFLSIMNEFVPFLDDLEVHSKKVVETISQAISQKHVEKHLNEHNKKMILLKEQWKHKHEEVVALASKLSVWDCIQESSEHVLKRWESINEWFTAEKVYLESLNSEWLAYQENLIFLKKSLSGIEETLAKSNLQSSDLESRQSKLKMQRDRLNALKTKWVVSKDSLENLLMMINNQLDTTPYSSESNISLLNREQFESIDPELKADTSKHQLAVEFREIGFLLEKFIKQIDDEVKHLGTQLGERSKVVQIADELSQWMIHAEKQLVKLNRVWIATRNDALRSAKAHVQNIINASCTDTSEENVASLEGYVSISRGEAELDRETINGVDMSEAATRLYLLRKEATGAKTSALNELIKELESHEENRTIKDQVLRLQAQLKRFVTRIEKREMICFAAKHFEKSRSYWGRQINSFKTRFEAFKQVADSLDVSDYKILQEENRLLKEREKAIEEGVLVTNEPLLINTSSSSSHTKSLREHRIECDRLEEDINAVKSKISEWKHENEVIDGSDINSMKTIEPKDLDTISVSAGLIFVTNSYHEDSSSMKSVLQAEPFSFNVDLSRFLGDCDRVILKLNQHRTNVNAIAESWHRIQDAQEKLLEQADFLVSRALQACFMVEEMSIPSEDALGGHTRLSRLANQLKTWQTELLPVGLILAETSTQDSETVNKEQPTSEAAMLAQRLIEIRKAGVRLVKSAPAKGPAIDTIVNRAAEQLLRHAHRMGDIATRAEELARLLQVKQEVFNKVKKSLDEMEGMSGLIPAVEHNDVLQSYLIIKEVKEIVAEAQDDSEKPPEVYVPDYMKSLTDLEQAEVMKLAKVDNENEAKLKIQLITTAETKLVSMKNEMFTRLHQIVMQNNQAFKAYSSEIRLYKLSSNEEAKPMPDVSKDPILQAIFERWSRLEKRMNACKAKLTERQAAWTFVNNSINDLLQWSDQIDQRASEILAEFNANAPISLVNALVNVENKWNGENPLDLLDTFSSQYDFYCSLLDSIQNRITTELSDRGISKHQIEEASKRLDSVKLLSNKVEERWTKEVLKYENVKNDIAKLSESLNVLSNEIDTHIGSGKMSSGSIEDEYKHFTAIQSCLLQLELLNSKAKNIKSANGNLLQGPNIISVSSVKGNVTSIVGLGREIEGCERKIRSLDCKGKQLLMMIEQKIEKCCQDSCRNLEQWLSMSIQRLIWIMQEPEERETIRNSKGKYNFRPEIDKQLIENRISALKELSNSFSEGRSMIVTAFNHTLTLKRTEHLVTIKPDTAQIQEVTEEKRIVEELIESEVEKLHNSMDTINLGTKDPSQEVKESSLPFLLRPIPKDPLLLTTEARAKISKMDVLTQELIEKFTLAQQTCMETTETEKIFDGKFVEILNSVIQFLLITHNKESNDLIDDSIIKYQVDQIQTIVNSAVEFSDKLSKALKDSKIASNKVQICFTTLYETLPNETEEFQESFLCEGSQSLHLTSVKIKQFNTWAQNFLKNVESLDEINFIQRKNQNNFSNWLTDKCSILENINQLALSSNNTLQSVVCQLEELRSSISEGQGMQIMLQQSTDDLVVRLMSRPALDKTFLGIFSSLFKINQMKDFVKIDQKTSKCCDWLREKLRNTTEQFNNFCNSLNSVLQDAGSKAVKWSSYDTNKARLGTWFSKVESDWSIFIDPEVNRDFELCKNVAEKRELQRVQEVMSQVEMFELFNSSASSMDQDPEVLNDYKSFLDRFHRVKYIAQERLAIHESRLERHEAFERIFRQFENDVTSIIDIQTNLQHRGLSLVTEALRMIPIDENSWSITDENQSLASRAILTSSVLPGHETLNSFERQIDSLIEEITNSKKSLENRLSVQILEIENQLKVVKEESVDMEEANNKFLELNNQILHTIPENLNELSNSLQNWRNSLKEFKIFASECQQGLKEIHDMMQDSCLYAIIQQKNASRFYYLPNNIEEKLERISKVEELIEHLEDNGKVRIFFIKLESAVTNFNDKIIKLQRINNINLTSLSDHIYRSLLDEFNATRKRLEFARDFWINSHQVHEELKLRLTELESSIEEWRNAFRGGYFEHDSCDKIKDRYRNMIIWSQELQEKLDSILANEYGTFIESADLVYPTTGTAGRKEIMEILQDNRVEIDSLQKLQAEFQEKLIRTQEKFSRAYDQYKELSNEIKSNILRAEKDLNFEQVNNRVINLDLIGLQTNLNVILNETRKRNHLLDVELNKMVYLDSKLNELSKKFEVFFKDPRIQSCNAERDEIKEFEQYYLPIKKQFQSSKVDSDHLLSNLSEIHKITSNLIPKIETIKDSLRMLIQGKFDSNLSDLEIVINLLNSTEEILSNNFPECKIILNNLNSKCSSIDFTSSTQYQIVETIQEMIEKEYNRIAQALCHNQKLFQTTISQTRSSANELTDLESRLNRVQDILKSMPEKPSDLISKEKILTELQDQKTILEELSQASKEFQKKISKNTFIETESIVNFNDNEFMCQFVQPDSKLEFSFSGFKRKLERINHLTVTLELRWSKARKEHDDFDRNKTHSIQCISKCILTLLSMCTELKDYTKSIGETHLVCPSIILSNFIQLLESDWLTLFNESNSSLESLTSIFYSISSDISPEIQHSIQIELDKMREILFESRQLTDEQINLCKSYHLLVEKFLSQENECNQIFQALEKNMENYSNSNLTGSCSKSEANKNNLVLKSLEHETIIFRKNLTNLNLVLTNLKTTPLVLSSIEGLSRKLSSIFDKTVSFEMVNVEKNFAKLSVSQLNPIEAEKIYENLFAKQEKIQAQIEERIIAQKDEYEAWISIELAIENWGGSLEKLAIAFDSWFFENGVKELTARVKRGKQWIVSEIEKLVAEVITTFDENKCETVMKDLKCLKISITELQDKLRQNQGPLKESLMKTVKVVQKLAIQYLDQKTTKLDCPQSDILSKQFTLLLSNLNGLKQLTDLSLTTIKERNSYLLKNNQIRQTLRDWLNGISKQIEEGPSTNQISQKAGIGRSAQKAKLLNFANGVQFINSWWQLLLTREDEINNLDQEIDSNTKMNVTRDLKYLQNIYEENKRNINLIIDFHQNLVDSLVNITTIENEWNSWWCEPRVNNLNDSYFQILNKGGLNILANLKDMQQIEDVKGHIVFIDQDLRSEGKKILIKLETDTALIIQEFLPRLQLHFGRNCQSTSFYNQLRAQINNFIGEARNGLTSFEQQLPGVMAKIELIEQQALNWNNRITKLATLSADLIARSKALKATWSTCPEVKNKCLMLPGQEATSKEIEERLNEFPAQTDYYRDTISNVFLTKKQLHTYAFIIQRDLQILQRDIIEMREQSMVLEVKVNAGVNVKKKLDEIIKESQDIGKGLTQLIESLNHALNVHKSWVEVMDKLDHWLREINQSTENLINMAGDKFLIESRIQRLENMDVIIQKSKHQITELHNLAIECLKYSPMEFDPELKLRSEVVFGQDVCSAYIQQTLKSQLAWSICYMTLCDGLKELKTVYEGWDEFDKVNIDVEKLLKELTTFVSDCDTFRPLDQQDIETILTKISNVVKSKDGLEFRIEKSLESSKKCLSKLPFAKELSLTDTEQKSSSVSGALGLAFSKYMRFNEQFKILLKTLLFFNDKMVHCGEIWNSFNEYHDKIQSDLDRISGTLDEIPTPKCEASGYKKITNNLEKISTLEAALENLSLDKLTENWNLLVPLVSSDAKSFLRDSVSELVEKKEMIIKELICVAKRSEGVINSFKEFGVRRQATLERLEHTYEDLNEIREKGFWNLDLELGVIDSPSEYLNQISLRKRDVEILLEKIQIHILRKIEQEDENLSIMIESGSLIFNKEELPLAYQSIEQCLTKVKETIKFSQKSLKNLICLIEQIKENLERFLEEIAEINSYKDQLRNQYLEEISDRVSMLEIIIRESNNLKDKIVQISLAHACELALSIDKFDWTKTESHYFRNLLNLLDLYRQESIKNLDEFEKEINYEFENWNEVSFLCDKFSECLDSFKEKLEVILYETITGAGEPSQQKVLAKLTEKIETLIQLNENLEENSSQIVTSIDGMIHTLTSEKKITNLKVINRFKGIQIDYKIIKGEIQDRLRWLRKQFSISESIVNKTSDLKKLVEECERIWDTKETENMESNLTSLQKIEKELSNNHEKSIQELKELQAELCSSDQELREFFENIVTSTNQMLGFKLQEIQNSRETLETSLKDHRVIRNLQIECDQILKRLQLNLRKIQETELVIPLLGGRLKQDQDFWTIDLIGDYEKLLSNALDLKESNLIEIEAILNDQIGKSKLLGESISVEEFHEEEIHQESLMSQTSKLVFDLKEDLTSLELSKKSYSQLNSIYLSLDEFIYERENLIQNQKLSDSVKFDDFLETIEEARTKIYNWSCEINEKSCSQLEQIRELTEDFVQHLIVSNKRRIISTTNGPFSDSTFLQPIRQKTLQLGSICEKRTKILNQMMVRWLSFKDRLTLISEWIKEEKFRESTPAEHSSRSIMQFRSFFSLGELLQRIQNEAQLEVDKLRECTKKCSEINSLIEMVNSFLEISKVDNISSPMASLASSLTIEKLAEVQKIKQNINSRASQDEELVSLIKDVVERIDVFKNWQKNVLQRVSEVEKICRLTDQLKESKNKCQNICEQVYALQSEQILGINHKEAVVMSIEKLINVFPINSELSGTSLIDNLGVLNELKTDLLEVNGRLNNLLITVEKDLMGLSDQEAIQSKHEQISASYEIQLKLLEEYASSKELDNTQDLEKCTTETSIMLQALLVQLENLSSVHQTLEDKSINFPNNKDVAYQLERARIRYSSLKVRTETFSKQNYDRKALLQNFNISSTKLLEFLAPLQKIVAQVSLEKDLSNPHALATTINNIENALNNLKNEGTRHLKDYQDNTEKLLTSVISVINSIPLSPNLREYINLELTVKLNCVDNLKSELEARIEGLRVKSKKWKIWIDEGTSFAEVLKKIYENIDEIKRKEFTSFTDLDSALVELKSHKDQLDQIEPTLLVHAKTGKDLSYLLPEANFKTSTKRLQEQFLEVQIANNNIIEILTTDQRDASIFNNNLVEFNTWANSIEQILKSATSSNNYTEGKKYLIDLQEKIHRKIQDKSSPLNQMKAFMDRICYRLNSDAGNEIRYRVSEMFAKVDKLSQQTNEEIQKQTNLDQEKQVWLSKLQKIEHRLEKQKRTLSKSFMLPSVLYCDPDETLVQKIHKGSIQNQEFKDILLILEDMSSDVRDLEAAKSLCPSVSLEPHFLDRINSAITSYERIKSDLEIYLKRLEVIWTDLNNFHVAFIEAEKWIVASSLRLQYLTQIVSDGPKGLEHIRRLLAVLKSQLVKFKTGQVTRLTNLAEKVNERFKNEIQSVEGQLTRLYEMIKAVSIGKDSVSWSQLSSQLSSLVDRLVSGYKDLQIVIESIDIRLNEESLIWHHLSQCISEVNEFLTTSSISLDDRIPGGPEEYILLNEQKCLLIKIESWKHELSAALRRVQVLIDRTEYYSETSTNTSISTTKDFMNMFPETLRLLAKYEANVPMGSTLKALKSGVDLQEEAERMLEKLNAFTKKDTRELYTVKAKWKAQLALERELDEWYTEKTLEFQRIIRSTNERIESNHRVSERTSNFNAWYLGLDNLLSTGYLESLYQKVLEKSKVLEDIRCRRLILLEEFRNHEFVKESNFDVILGKHESLLEALDEALVMRKEFQLETKSASALQNHLSHDLDRLIQRLTGLERSDLDAIKPKRIRREIIKEQTPITIPITPITIQPPTESSITTEESGRHSPDDWDYINVSRRLRGIDMASRMSPGRVSHSPTMTRSQSQLVIYENRQARAPILPPGGYYKQRKLRLIRSNNSNMNMNIDLLNRPNSITRLAPQSSRKSRIDDRY